MITRGEYENRLKNSPVRIEEIFDDGTMVASIYGNKFHLTADGKRMYDESIKFAIIDKFIEGIAIVTDLEYNDIMIDQNGKPIHDEKYSYISEFKDGIACVVDLKREAYHISKGLMNDNKFIPMYDETFDAVNDFIDGIAIVSKDGEEFHINMNGKRFYKDVCKYDYVTPFDKNGLAKATKGDTIYTINLKGERVSSMKVLTE